MRLTEELDPTFLHAHHELPPLHDDLHPGAPEEDHGVGGDHAQLPHEDPAGLDLLVVDEVGSVEVADLSGDRAGVKVNIAVLGSFKLEIPGRGGRAMAPVAVCLYLASGDNILTILG